MTRLVLKRLAWFCAACGWLFVSNDCFSQEPDADNTVAANVGEYTVLASEVDAEVQRVIGNQQPSEDAEKLIRATALQQLVRRQLVMGYLQEKSYLPNTTQVQVRVELITEGLQKVNKSLEEHLQEQKISEVKFRESVAWNMGWTNYLDKFIADDNIKAYYQRNRADFDGTKVRVAHILLKVDKAASVEEWKGAAESLKTIKDEIENDSITFSDAAKKYSQAATAENGGDIGLIQRHHPMPAAFSKVAFSLKPGATSDPVQTAFGLHLIHCLTIEPGADDWQKSRDEVVSAMKEYLFEWIAESERKKVTIKYSDHVPHFREGTMELAD